MKNLTATAKFFMFAALSGAAIITLAVSPVGMTSQKLAGVMLALLGFLPVFILLLNTMKVGDHNRILGTFVGGFFFKLILIVAGVWLAVGQLDFDTVPFTVGCLSFLFAFQLVEALYFWGANQH